MAPEFAATSAPVVGQAGIDGALALLHDVLGVDLDASIVAQADDRETARCQQALAGAVGKCVEERVKEFNRCKRTALKAGAGNSDDLRSCMTSDPSGRVARRCDRQAPSSDRIRADIGRRCVS